MKIERDEPPVRLRKNLTQTVIPEMYRQEESNKVGAYRPELVTSGPLWDSKKVILKYSNLLRFHTKHCRFQAAVCVLNVPTPSTDRKLLKCAFGPIYVCETCAKTFITHSHLNRHRKRQQTTHCKGTSTGM